MIPIIIPKRHVIPDTVVGATPVCCKPTDAVAFTLAKTMTGIRKYFP